MFPFSMNSSRPAWRVVLQPAVIVGAFGHFACIYDRILFRSAPDIAGALVGLEEAPGKDFDYSEVI
jgi:hypothetical protein